MSNDKRKAQSLRCVVDDAVGDQIISADIVSTHQLSYSSIYDSWWDVVCFERNIQNSHREINMHNFDSWISFLQSEEGWWTVSNFFSFLLNYCAASCHLSGSMWCLLFCNFVSARFSVYAYLRVRVSACACGCVCVCVYGGEKPSEWELRVSQAAGPVCLEIFQVTVFSKSNYRETEWGGGWRSMEGIHIWAAVPISWVFSKLSFSFLDNYLICPQYFHQSVENTF